MTYIYIFEDGTIEMTPVEPSEDDLISINEGILIVLRTQAKVEQLQLTGVWE